MPAPRVQENKAATQTYRRHESSTQNPKSEHRLLPKKECQNKFDQGTQPRKPKYPLAEWPNCYFTKAHKEKPHPCQTARAQLQALPSKVNRVAQLQALLAEASLAPRVLKLCSQTDELTRDPNPRCLGGKLPKPNSEPTPSPQPCQRKAQLQSQPSYQAKITYRWPNKHHHQVSSFQLE